MYCFNELTITMNNNIAATTAIAAAKNALLTTFVEEDRKGLFARFSDTLLTKNNEIRCNSDVAIWGDTYELVLPEILKAIAVQGNEFHGNSEWDSDYDTERWEFSFDGKELTITATRHNIDDEPVCTECDADELYTYDMKAGCYVCPECGDKITEEEFYAACEVTTIQKFTF